MELFLEPRLEGEDGGVWKLNLESPPLAARSWMTWKKPKKNHNHCRVAPKSQI